MAEWMPFAPNVFIDASSLDKVNNKMRILTYLNIPNGESIKIFYEFNCKEKAHKELSRTIYSMPDLQGDMTLDNRLKKWEHSAKNTTMGALLAASCGQ